MPNDGLFQWLMSTEFQFCFGFSLCCGDGCSQIKRIVDPLLLSDADIERLMTTLLREMECGLSGDPQLRKLTSLQMENTYVCSLLDGKGLLMT